MGKELLITVEKRPVLWDVSDINCIKIEVRNMTDERILQLLY